MSGPKQAGVDRPPRFKIFRRTRGGVALTREEVQAVADGIVASLAAAGISMK